MLEAAPEEIWLAIVNEDAQRELKTRFRARGYGGRLFGLSDLRERFQLRLAACRLLAQEIRRRGVAGDVAELGVYQGEFAEELNRLFPERRLYLFDTFSGFDGRDIGSADGARAKAGQFSDTSAEAVLARMETPGQVVIKKGFFRKAWARWRRSVLTGALPWSASMRISTGRRWRVLRIFIPGCRRRVSDSG